jgi:hypothetical protein
MKHHPDDIIWKELELLKQDRDRLQRVLEAIANYTYSDEQGYRAAFYSLRWYARTALTGETAPQRKSSPKKDKHGTA